MKVSYQLHMDENLLSYRVDSDILRFSSPVPAIRKTAIIRTFYEIKQKSKDTQIFKE